MFNIQSIRNAALTASFVSTGVGLSILLSANPSKATNLTIPLPLDKFILDGNAQIIPTSAATPFFDSDMIAIEGEGSATSGASPLLPIKRKQTILHFNYAFFGGGDLSLLLNNTTTGASTFIETLAESNGQIADFDLTEFITIPGSYSVSHVLTGGGSAHFNNFTVVTKHVPEHTATLGLLSFGIAAFAFKQKRKISLGFLAK
ncbi:MAG: hypothetical protein F6K62_23200 [Sphaerospermopsis sp. SIO1G2]|nr:hypothetical protein [Sphaerospermopsis sp. SIO1G2]